MGWLPWVIPITRSIATTAPLRERFFFERPPALERLGLLQPAAHSRFTRAIKHPNRSQAQHGRVSRALAQQYGLAAVAHFGQIDNGRRHMRAGAGIHNGGELLA